VTTPENRFELPRTWHQKICCDPAGPIGAPVHQSRRTSASSRAGLPETVLCTSGAAGGHPGPIGRHPACANSEGQAEFKAALVDNLCGQDSSWKTNLVRCLKPSRSSGCRARGARWSAAARANVLGRSASAHVAFAPSMDRPGHRTTQRRPARRVARDLHVQRLSCCPFEPSFGREGFTEIEGTPVHRRGVRGNVPSLCHRCRRVLDLSYVKPQHTGPNSGCWE